MRQTSRKLALLALVVVWSFLSYPGDVFAAQRKEKPKKAAVAKRAVPVVELRNLEQLKAAFQRDAGKVRFVTILSPT